MNKNIIKAAIAAMLVLVLSLSAVNVAPVIASANDIGINVETSTVDYVIDPEAEIKTIDEETAHGRYDNWGKDNASKTTINKNVYTYADGTTTSKYMFKNLVTAKTNAKDAKTVVKSGVTSKPTGQTSYSNSYGSIDVSNMNAGYVTLKLTKSANTKVRGGVDYTDAKGNVTYYDWYMEKDKSYNIPMYSGDGKYTISIMENTSDNKYSIKLSVTVTVKLDSELAPWLASTKDADYANAPKAVAKAKELTKDCKTTQDKINVIYNWVIDTIDYDKAYGKAAEKAREAAGRGGQQGAVYDLDFILTEKKGVCGDISALTAGMLRSLGIPCKVAYGKNSSGGAHIWIAVWNETGTVSANQKMSFFGGMKCNFLAVSIRWVCSLDYPLLAGLKPVKS